MSELGYFTSVDDQERMGCLAAMLGQAYIQRRTSYIAATREATPIAVRPTPEGSTYQTCGQYNFEWNLGSTIITGYMGTAFPDIEEHLLGGAQAIHEVTAAPTFGTGIIGRMRARMHENRLNMQRKITSGPTLNDFLLRSQAIIARGFTQCVTIETSGLPEQPKALHSLNCESPEAQFMFGAFQGNTGSLVKMHVELASIDPAAFRSPEVYDTLQTAYLPPTPQQ